MRYQTLVLCSFASLVAPLVACSGSDGKSGSAGSNGIRAVVRVTRESPGKNCAGGGSRVDYGRDTNVNKKLDDNEVTGTEFVCNGSDGTDGVDGKDASDGADGVLSAVSVSDEPPGSNCEHGGKRVDIGPDADLDGVPDTDSSTSYVCDGKTGSNGKAAAPLLVSVSDEGDGSNCGSGGKRVDYGLDTNGNGGLDSSEILGTSYVCHGNSHTDGSVALVAVTPVTAGQFCAAGGNQIDYGQDENHNGTLDTAEIKGTRYVCKGASGFSGKQALFEIVNESAGAACTYGGKRINTGLDADGNSTLEQGEITGTSYVCSGDDAQNGATSLVNVTPEPAGSNCVIGGSKVDSGFDQNNDATLQNSEITNTSYVCNGTNGSNANTRAGLVRTTPELAGPNCSNGGQRIESGVDTSGNGTLEPAEVTHTDYACNGVNGTNGTDGADGANALVVITPEPAGANCANAGERVDNGLDANANGSLSPAEIVDTRYVCNALNGTNGSNGTNGADGTTTLVATSVEAAGAHCASGGQRIDTGIDTNHNGLLGASEVLATSYVCNGATGSTGSSGSDAANSLVTVANEPAGSNCANGGQAISFGLDANRDTALTGGEISGTRYVCKGTSGTAGTNGSNAVNTLFTISAEPAGANCATGGQRIDYGVDDDGNSILGVGEIDNTRYVCNGAAGSNGTSGSNGLATLVNIATEPSGANCPGPGGGHRIQVGLDDNADSALAAGEVDSTSYVCDFAPLLNGSFETSNYTGWTIGVTQQLAGFAALANLADGTTLAASGTVFDFIANANQPGQTSLNLPYTYHSSAGTRVSVFLQNGPNDLHIYQVVTVPATATTLNWDMYYHSYAAFATNQQLTVSMRNPTTTASVATLFQTSAASPISTTGDAMQAFSASVTALRGQTLRLDVDLNVQQNWFPAAFDNFRFQ